jgi:hypothetical protein
MFFGFLKRVYAKRFSYVEFVLARSDLKIGDLNFDLEILTNSCKLKIKIRLINL